MRTRLKRVTAPGLSNLTHTATRKHVRMHRCGMIVALPVTNSLVSDRRNFDLWSARTAALRLAVGNVGCSTRTTTRQPVLWSGTRASWVKMYEKLGEAGFRVEALEVTGFGHDVT
jgi:hypothetical protein